VKSQEEVESPRDDLELGTSVVLVSKVNRLFAAHKGGTG
jgi:hypothetical protein